MENIMRQHAIQRETVFPSGKNDANLYNSSAPVSDKTGKGQSSNKTGTLKLMDSPSSQYDELTDEQLIERYRNGQEDLFETLIERYRLELFHFLARFLGNRITAEDIFQESFLQVHLSIDTFDTDRRFKPWLFTIAANKARDHLRREARRPAASLQAPIGSGDDGSSFVDLLADDIALPYESMADEEIREKVRAAVEQMSDHLREILLLAYFEKFSYNEIAEVLQIPLGTVKSRLHTAVGTFANLWKTQNPEEKPS